MFDEDCAEAIAPVVVLLARFLPNAKEVTEAIEPTEPLLLGFLPRSGGRVSSSRG